MERIVIDARELMNFKTDNFRELYGSQGRVTKDEKGVIHITGPAVIKGDIPDEKDFRKSTKLRVHKGSLTINGRVGDLTDITDDLTTKDRIDITVTKGVGYHVNIISSQGNINIQGNTGGMCYLNARKNTSMIRRDFFGMKRVRRDPSQGNLTVTGKVGGCSTLTAGYTMIVGEVETSKPERKSELSAYHIDINDVGSYCELKGGREIHVRGRAQPLSTLDIWKKGRIIADNPLDGVNVCVEGIPVERGTRQARHGSIYAPGYNNRNPPENERAR